MTTAIATAALPVEFTVNDIVFRGLRWHSGAKHKVIALHGWLDNCASFNTLLPHLSELDCVAIDMAGHGLSGHRSHHLTYNIWQDVAEISGIAEQLGWERFSLLGHSRGAAASTLFAGTFPQKIDRLCLIDAVIPKPIAGKTTPQHLAYAIEKMAKRPRRRRTLYPDFDTAVAIRTNSKPALGMAEATILGERGVCQDDQGYYWSYDPRLLMPSEICLSESQVKEFIDAYPCTALVVKSRTNSVIDVFSYSWLLSHPKLDVIEREGTHHLHLNTDDAALQAVVEPIAAHFAE